MTSSGWLEPEEQTSEPLTAPTATPPPIAPPAPGPSEKGNVSAPPPEQAPTSPGPGGRRKVLAIGLVIVVLASIAGWLAGRQIKSPAEIAANTAPPDPSLITAPVEKVALSADVVVRGTVRYGAPQAVTLPKSALKPGTGIVSVPPTKGAQLGEGTVALSVSGRPVFILQGAQPAYRDLGPGDEGADVRQLEEALARLGFDPGPRDGLYDGGAAAAVSAWYRAAGFKPFGPTEEQLAALRAAEAEQYGGQESLVSAEAELATARAAAATAAANVARATSALNAAREDHRAAQIELNGARAEPSPSPAAIAAAEAKVIQTNAAIGVAQEDLSVANVEVANANEAIRVAQKRVALTGGRERRLNETLSAIAGKLGIQVPADEVLFFGNLPLRVDDVTVKVGEETSVPVMTVSNQELAVDSALSPNNTRLVKEGLGAHIEDQDRGMSVEGVVAEVADTDGTNGVDAGRYYLRVTPHGLLTVGASVVVTIRVRTTEGEVLAVPVAALSVAADGTSRVQVQDKDGRTRYVTVTPGLAAKGMVELKSVKGRLAAGDLVVVGEGGPPEAKA